MNLTGVNLVVAVICMLLGIVWLAHDIYVIYELFTYNMGLIEFIWNFFLVNVIYFVLELFLVFIMAICTSDASDF